MISTRWRLSSTLVPPLSTTSALPPLVLDALPSEAPCMNQAPAQQSALRMGGG